MNGRCRCELEEERYGLEGGESSGGAGPAGPRSRAGRGGGPRWAAEGPRAATPCDALTVTAGTATGRCGGGGGASCKLACITQPVYCRATRGKGGWLPATEDRKQLMRELRFCMYSGATARPRLVLIIICPTRIMWPSSKSSWISFSCNPHPDQRDPMTVGKADSI